MSKKDINTVKFLKPQVKVREQQDKGTARFIKMSKSPTINTYSYESEAERKHKEICKEASEMSAKEQLMNYFGTGDPTYIGVGCKWDLLSKLGLRKKRLL